ncbi:MAG: caspase family protein [Moraxellaceae bacterium]|nr:caspase family protein [Moraxellaceae bacterium]
MSHSLKIVLMSLFLLNSPAFADQKLALIIGNSQYDGAMGALQNPVNDAQAIDGQLIKLGFKTSLVKNANKIRMLEAIDDFSNQISRGDTVVFYYAGHGASANGNNYLIPIGAESPKNDKWFDENFIDLDTKIASVLSQSQAAYKIVVMDACRDNPVARTRSSGTARFARADQSQNAKGLAFLYSASKGQQAQDGSGQRNSPFTTALVKHLANPNAIWPVLVEEVTDEVREATKGQQEVWAEGNTLARLVLNPQAHSVAASQVVERVVERERVVVQENPQAAEITYWNNIKNSNRSSDYQAYLNKYPKGLFVEVAQAELQPKPVQLAQVQVRDKPTPQASLSNSDEQLMQQGMWRDPKTDLIWMRCSVGQTWLVKNCSGEGKEMNWKNAMKAGNGSNYGRVTGWRLPTIDELKTLMIEGAIGYASVFISQPKSGSWGWYWSSSPVAGNSGYAWVVHFSDGYDYNGNKSHGLYVRLVRSSQ